MTDYTIRKMSDDEFPSALREIPQPPEELWIVGELPPPETRLLTVVGSRKNSPYGDAACRELISGLKGYDIAIVSGLALGIDAIAHDEALTQGLQTIAVPGSGLSPHVLYPRTHLSLAKRICVAGGVLLSEFSPDTPPAPWTFPKRNRIMAGLAHATLLIEAAEKSGTLITARLAADYNRELMVVPGSIFSPLSKGTNQFLALGATPVTSSRDILSALGFSDESIPATKPLDLSGFSPIEQDILMALDEPIVRDALIERIGLPAREVNVLLMKLEIKGVISDSPLGLRRLL
jgi:DNA processing protein